MVVKVLKCNKDAGNKESYKMGDVLRYLVFIGSIFTGLDLLESPVLSDVESEVSSGEQVHDEVEVISILKGEVHIYEEGVLKLAEEMSFTHNGIHASFGDDPGFREEEGRKRYEDV